MRYIVRPISDRTWFRDDYRRITSRFDATWTQTLELLTREIGYLDGRDVVLEVDVPERGIRQDGMLRADAKAATPAVVVAFETKIHGSMLYRCDRYSNFWTNRPGWQENVRAIAKTLEVLRAVDRYGATETGQQYTGFKALPAGRAMPASHMTRDEALGVLGLWGRVRYDLPAIPAEHVNTDPGSLRSLHKAARRAAHPDRHEGSQSAWDQVELAAKVLGVSS